MELKNTQAIMPVSLMLVRLSDLTQLLIDNSKTTDAHWTLTDTEKVACEIISFGIENNCLNIENYGYQIHAIENVVEWYAAICSIDDDTNQYNYPEIAALKPVVSEELCDAICQGFRHYDACLVDVDY